MARVTMRDIADATGVSISTVSRVIRNDHSVDPELRNKVEDAIQSLGYSSVRNGKRDDQAAYIGLIVPNVANPFYATMIKGIERVAKRHDYALIVADSEESIEVENRNLQFISSRDIRGLICVSCSTSANPIATELISRHFPLVFLDRVTDQEGANIVMVDNVEGAYQAVKYLLRLGHQRIAYISGLKTASTERDRFEGYCKALESEGVPFDERLIAEGEYNLDKAYAAIDQFLKRNLEFTAIFSSNDVMAFGAKQAVEDNGRRVPEDVSIVGYDDINFAHTIALTVVSQPVQEMARTAMTLLVDLIEGRETAPQRIVLRPALVIRNSCRRLDLLPSV